MANSRRELLIFAAVLVFAALILVAIAGRNELAGFVELLKSYGYLGAFALGFLSSFTIFLPSPAFIAVLGMAAFLNPLLLGIATGVGSAIGEMTGYALGRGAEAALHKKKGHFHKDVERISKLFKRYRPDLVVFAFAAIPLLPVDALGIFCGAIRYDWKRFLLFMAVGKIIKFTALAFAGGAALALLGPLVGI
jgi:membrane protein YqaA with SNARE-associated domain